MKRRDLLKGLAGLPFLSAYGYFAFNQKRNVEVPHTNAFQSFLQSKIKPSISSPVTANNSVRLRLGIIGTGGRGMYLLRALGFIEPSAVGRMKEKALHLFRSQPDLNIEMAGVCDLYQPRAKKAAMAAANIDRLGASQFNGRPVKQYAHYKDLIQDPNIDAIVIATSDHWHAPITMEAAKAGKHVYCEKALTHNLEDVFKVRDAVKQNGITFQLGHQNRQAANYKQAAQVVEQGLLGDISLVETTTNRNSPNGAWLYDIPGDADLQNVDWDSFVRDGKKPFNKEHFFRWRLFWDYGTGLAGDLLTHEYDCINQILNVGIPERVSASGGIYHWKDNRQVPDVFQAIMEYPQKNLSVIYSASLASELSRPRLLMGTEASMEIGGDLSLKVEHASTLYHPFIKNKEVTPGQAISLTKTDQQAVDAISSATEKYFASRGLLYTSQNGQMVDTTHLHLAEWLNGIRTGSPTSCNIDRAFEEAITAQMATMAYRDGQVKRWDGERVI